MGTVYESWVFLMRLARNLRDFQMFNGEFQQSLKCCYTNFFKHSSFFRWVCISCHLFLKASDHLGQHFMYRRAMFSGNKICDRSAKFLAEVRGKTTGCFTSTNRRHETPNNSAAEALEFNFGLQFLGLGRCLATPLQPPNCCWRKQRRKVRFSFFQTQLMELQERTWIKDCHLDPFRDFQFSFSDERLFFSHEFWGNFVTHVGLQSLCQVLGVTRVTDKAKTEGNCGCSDRNGHVVRTSEMLFLDFSGWMSLFKCSEHNWR